MYRQHKIGMLCGMGAVVVCMLAFFYPFDWTLISRHLILLCHVMFQCRFLSQHLIKQKSISFL